jgi:hypothetical protein
MPQIAHLGLTPATARGRKVPHVVDGEVQGAVRSVRFESVQRPGSFLVLDSELHELTLASTPENGVGDQAGDGMSSLDDAYMFAM